VIDREKWRGIFRQAKANSGLFSANERRRRRMRRRRRRRGRRRIGCP